MPHDPDSEDDDVEDEEPGEVARGKNETDWLNIWALCIGNGISDSEWEGMTIIKIRALMKSKNKQREFEIVLHGGEVNNKKPKKAKYLADLGFYLPNAGSQ
jgi:hypothetical protein